MAKVRHDWPATKRATCIEHVGGIARVLYRGTCVFAMDPYSGTVTLNSGGWRTFTTKARINEAFEHFGCSFLSLYQKNHEWFVSDRRDDTTIDYSDGMTINVAPNAGRRAV